MFRPLFSKTFSFPPRKTHSANLIRTGSWSNIAQILVEFLVELKAQRRFPRNTFAPLLKGVGHVLTGQMASPSFFASRTQFASYCCGKIHQKGGNCLLQPPTPHPPTPYKQHSTYQPHSHWHTITKMMLRSLFPPLVVVHHLLLLITRTVMMI